MTTDHASILLVDDEEDLLHVVGRALRADHHHVIEATNGHDALAAIADQRFDLLLVDIVLPGMGGLDLIREVARLVPDSERPRVILITGYATVDRAIEAVKLGAADFLRKPFGMDELRKAVVRALGSRAAHGTRSAGRVEAVEVQECMEPEWEPLECGGAQEHERGASPGMRCPVVGSCQVMQEVVRLGLLAARTSSTVLITGEMGTGRELGARTIHRLSARRDGPFVSVNCAAIADHEQELELFGRVTSVTGGMGAALPPRKGRFALADRGTIFLKSVDALTSAVQSRLLRVLTDGEVEPLGAEVGIRVDVRVIASSTRDLGELVSDGVFLADLFHRLNVIAIDLPPLRQRLEDIPDLVDHFVRKHGPRLRRRIERVDKAVIAGLQDYHWPGNVSELESAVERAIVLSEGSVITADVLPALGTTPRPHPQLPDVRLHENLRWMERETIRDALDRAKGVKRDAAEILGISPRALSYYLRKYRR